MKRYEKMVFAGLAGLVIAALAAVVLTRDWANSRDRLQAIRKASKLSTNLVDTRPLETAEQVAPLAVTRTEQDYAQQALRLADDSVDLAFAAAIHEATENAPPLTPQMRKLQQRVQAGQAAVAADQSRIMQFTAALAHATRTSKDDFQQLIAIANEQLALDQDDLDDAQQQLQDSGGDRQATIKQLLAQHKASEPQNGAAQIAAASAASSIEETRERNIVAEVRAWSSLHAKQETLAQAEQDALNRAAQLTATHNTLEQQQENPSNTNAGTPEGTNGQQAPSPGENSALAILRRQTENKANLADFGRRINTEQQLAAVYANWIAFTSMREKVFLHEILVSVLWILLIVLAAMLADHWVTRFFAHITGDRRTLMTTRALVLFLVQAVALAAALLVVAGMPSNFATVLALVGAGLTVALKDFIVGFFGWFVLMGKDGIRPGDWVEINGVSGEVLKVGFLHTVLLETGNWADAGHPTGRKVSFVNSFATEGHYFNFSTSGQWLWDEIEAQIPEGAEPFEIADEIRKIATTDTAENARLAEEEWNRAAHPDGEKTFSAQPAVRVQPTQYGISVMLRYITRANERHGVRARLYHDIVDLLHARKATPAGAAPAPQTVSRNS